MPKNYYEDSYIAESLKNIKVDRRLKREFPSLESDPFINAKRLELYERYGLHYYSSKEQFRETISKTNKTFWNRHNLEEYWKQYLHRDELLATGQYRKWLTEKFREQYMKEGLMRISGVIGQRMRMNFLLLSDEKIHELAMLVNNETTSKDRKMIPLIQEYYPVDGVEADIQTKKGYEERFMKAFQQLGLPYEDFKPINKKLSEMSKHEQDITIIKGVERQYRYLADYNSIIRLNKQGDIYVIGVSKDKSDAIIKALEERDLL